MKVSVNNKEIETAAHSVAQLLEEQHLPLQGIAVAVANRLVPRGRWEDFALVEGMQIVIIKAACGG